jgi:hypothetical protein
MTPKKVLPKASAQSVDETPVPKVTAPAKKSSELAPSKSAAKVAKATPPKAVAKATAKAVTKTAVKKASPAPSPATSPSRKPARVKKPALPVATAPASPPRQAPSRASLAELTSPTPHPSASAPQSKAAEAPPVVNDAELWEQGSPIRTRIAQLRTRNAFLEEQLQRWRPPVVQVRGKKK